MSNELDRNLDKEIVVLDINDKYVLDCAANICRKLAIKGTISRDFLPHVYFHILYLGRLT
jgi:hypothetical protein